VLPLAELQSMLNDAMIFNIWRGAAVIRHPVLHFKHWRRMGHWPDVALPRSFSERMLWRKLFDRNPLFVTLADKLAAKAWLAQNAPDLPTPRTLWAGARAEDIPDALLRPGVIVKTNHGSGFAMPIRGTPPARSKVVEAAQRSLAREFGQHRGEWMYAHVPRRVFIEELVTDGGGELMDMRFFAGGGRVAFAIVSLGVRTPAQRGMLLSRDGDRLPGVPIRTTPLPEDTPAPAIWPEAVAIAERLSRGFDLLRFDMLWAGGRLWGGEITVVPAAGYWAPPAPCDALMEHVQDLRRSWFLREAAATSGWIKRAYAEALERSIAADRGPLP
jgi:hypothetical protein